MPRMPVTELSRKVAALEAKLNKSPATKGATVMADIDQAPNTYFLRRPSGIMNLDVDLGGGLPAGGLSYISGPDGVGKTFLLYKHVAMNQRLYGDTSCVAMGVSEAAPDHFFMRRCGVWIRIPEEMIEERQKERKERGIPAFTKEELAYFRHKTVGKVKILRGATGEELLGGLLDCFESKCFDLLTCDSISAVLPDADAGKDLDDAAKRAAAALMLTRFFQTYLNGTTGYSGLNPTTTIFTSQVRSNSKKAEAQAHIAKWLPDYTPQGAWAAKHGKLVDILLKPGSKEKEDVKGLPDIPGTLGQAATAASKKRVAIGKGVYYEILKGKAGVHEGITGEYDFNYDNLHDDSRSIIVAGLHKGIVQERQGIVTFFNPSTGLPFAGMEAIAGIDRLAEMIRTDFDLEFMARRAVLTASGIECAYR